MQINVGTTVPTLLSEHNPTNPNSTYNSSINNMQNMQMMRMFAMSLAASEGLRGQQMCERANLYVNFIQTSTIPYIYNTVNG